MSDPSLYTYQDSAGKQYQYGDPTINSDAIKGLGLSYVSGPKADPLAAPAQPYTTTPTAAGPVNTPLTSSAQPTIASLYGTENSSDQGIDAAVGVYKNLATTPVDEAGIRANALSQLQTEIDATNAVYAEKMRQAQIAGEGRLGSNAAISARRGLLGSDFGSQANDKVTTDNQAVYSGIDQEKAAALAAITDKGNTLAQQEIADKTTAKQQAAENYISFLAQQGTRQTARTSDAASRALAAGIDLTTASPDTVSAIAKSYNISPDALVSSFVSAKNAAAAAQKSNLVTAPTTDSVYKSNPDGTLTTVQQGQATDSLIKEWQQAVADGSFSGGLADYQSFKSNAKVGVGINPATGEPYERTGPGVAGTGTPASSGAGAGAGGGGGSSTTSTPAVDAKAQYTAGQPITALPKGVSSQGGTIDGAALGLINGTQAPSEIKSRGALGQNEINQATAISLALTKKPFDVNAADAAFTFRKSTQYNNYTAAAPSALRNIQAISTDAQNLGLSGITDFNDFRIGMIARGLWPGATPAQSSAAKDIQSRLAQSQDDIGLLLGTGTGSDTKLALGGLIYNPNGSPKTTADLTKSVTDTISNKLGDYYKKAGVTDPSLYLQQDTAKLLGGTGTQVASAVNGIPTAPVLPADVDSALSANAKVDDAAKTVTLPRSIWSTFGPNMDAVLAGVQAKGYKLLIQ
jgi:hypothetical protein